MTTIRAALCASLLLLGCAGRSSAAAPVPPSTGVASGASSIGTNAGTNANGSSEANAGAMVTTGSASGSATRVSDASMSEDEVGSILDASTSTSIEAQANTDANPLAVRPSPGCGKALTVATGTWVSQPAGCAQGIDNQGTVECQAIPPGSTVPATATLGSPEHRGWWVYIPATYDPGKPYRVIFNAAGCGDNNWFNAGEDGYPYYNVDNGQAILVGLDYDTYSDVPSCYDNRSAQSNDFSFFPWLQNEIENEFCVDMSHEFFSGYLYSGAWVAQQLNCAFPEKLRGTVAVSGCEPGASGFPGAQFSPCVDKPSAAFYVHDFHDTDNTYACILPACARMLRQNGCITAAGTPYTACNPLDATMTTPYPVPAGLQLPNGAVCNQFTGCPADYPVVFCTTYDQGPSDDQNWGVVPLLWDFMNDRLAN